MADFNGPHCPIDGHIANQPNRPLGLQIDNRKRHQRIIVDFTCHPVGRRFHACRTGAGQPCPVALISQRVGGEQIGGMALHLQRLKPAKAPA